MMSLNINKLLLLVLFFISTTFLNADDTKIYKVVVLKNWKPYYTIDKNNKPSGYAVELFEKLASNINLKYEYVIANSWKEANILLETKQADIMPNMGIALKRENYVSFTQTTDLFEISLFKNINANETNQKVAVVERNVCTKLIPKINQILYPNYKDALNDLVDNKITSLCYPKTSVEFSIKQNNIKNIQIAGDALKVIKRAIAVTKENEHLLEKFNYELLRLQSNGQYYDIYHKWFMEHKDIQLNYEELVIILLLLSILALIVLYIIRSKKLILTKNELDKKIKEIDSLNDRLYLAADEALCGYWEWHIDNNDLFLSNGLKAFLGYEPHELEENFETFRSFVHKDDFDDVMEIANAYIKKDRDNYKAKFRVKHKDGHYKWVYAVGNIIREQNIFFGFHVDIDDLTTTKELLISQSKAAMMGEMVGHISHQFKQPLSIISLTATNELVCLDFEEEITDEQIRKDAKEIIKQIKYLSKTIDTFRDFLKPNNERSDIEVSKVINSSLEIVNKSLKNNDIELIKEINFDPTIFINSSELMQVFINLLNNAKDALKASQNENCKIWIKTIKQNDKIIITIEDTAGGIKEENMKKVFDAYFTTKEKSGGTGLGLYIVKTIITEHLKGDITVSNSKEGAIFNISLPLS